ncbi:MAG: hypothetical protein SD837_08730 [Candidatus Electrothrix scaldis]|nr:MAG: hypothetical protein SD837_08730 [Candidatus Electrothrix sp. GW3-3]
MQLNDKKPDSEIEVKKEENKTVQPKWISQLRHNPIRPGIGIAKLKIGDPEQDIQGILGVATRDSNHVIKGVEKIISILHKNSCLS